MHLRPLVAFFAALVLIVVGIILWFRFSKTLQQSSTTTTSYLDSTARADSATMVRQDMNKSAPRDSTPNVDRPQSPALQPTPMGLSNIPAPTQSLIIPVDGVRADKLVDTYTQARATGRTHDAIDIVAPHNAQVIAAAAGTIVRLFESVRGGTTIYELSPDGHTVFYYAHLDRYAEGLTKGERVQQGQLLGYVGDTGDAGAGNYHLHFAIWLIQDPKKFWDGQNVNPYPILRQVK